MNEFLQETLALTWRWFKHFRKEPYFAMFSVIQPIFWLVLFGSLFSRSWSNPGGNIANYRDFLTSGIIIMTVMFNSFQSGVPLLFDRENKFLERLFSSPISKWSIVSSRFLFSTSLSIVQALIILIVSYVLGSALPSIFGIVQIIIIALVFGAGLTMVSISLAFFFKRHSDFFATMGFINLPTIFLSSALVPLALMPAWMQTVAHLNPMTYAIEGARYVMTGSGFALLTSIQGLVAFNVVCILIASKLLKNLQA